MFLLVPAHPGSSRQRAVKRLMCVYVCVCVVSKQLLPMRTPLQVVLKASKDILAAASMCTALTDPCHIDPSH